MATADFSEFHDDKKDLTYKIKDATARDDIAALNYKVCATFGMDGGYNAERDYNIFSLASSSAIKGRFVGIDGSYIRMLFDQSALVNYSKPVYFMCKTSLDATEWDVLPVYLDRNGTESIEGWFNGHSVLDFVYDANQQCFFMVNAQKATTSAYGQVMLSSDTQSTSESVAATSLAVKTVRDMITSATGVNIQIVNTLPTVDISQHTIYLVPKTTAGTNNVYDEYINTDGTSSGWELIGSTEVDLSNYYTQTQVDTLLADKVDKVSGKGLSTEDYTTAEQSKLAGIASGAEVNVQSDYTQTDTTADDYIKNKPTLATVATSGDYGDLINKPTIPAAQVNADWNASSGVAQILNKPTLASVATSGDADDVAYDNTSSGLTASNAQDAIDEIAGDLADKIDKDNGTGDGTLTIMRKSGESWAKLEADTGGIDNTKIGLVAGDGIVRMNAKVYNPNTFVSSAFGVFDITAQQSFIKTTINATNMHIADDAASLNYVDLSYDNGNLKIDGDVLFNGGNTTLSSQLSAKADASSLATVATSGDYTDLSNTPSIPSALADLSDDSTHRVVTDTEKSTWNGKQNALTAGSNIYISNNTISARTYRAGQTFATKTFNTLCFTLTGGQKELYTFIPMPFLEKLPSLTRLTIGLVLRHADGGYPFIRDGSTYTQVGDSYVYIINNGTKMGGISAVAVSNLSEGGFTLRITLTNQLCKASGSTTAVTNNVPLAGMLTIAGTISTQ